MAEDPVRSVPARRFGPFLFDRETLELFRDGVPVPIEPRPARILDRLLDTPGRLVDREELRRLGWPRLPGAADDSLNTCIAQIRTALQDSAADPVWIETLRGRGYRFVGTVEDAATATASGDRRGPAALGVALALLALTGLLVLRGPTPWSPGPDEIVGDDGASAPVTSSGRTSGGAVPADVAAAVAAIDYRSDVVLDAEGALVLADSAAARYPDEPAVLAARASVLMRLGRNEDAWAAVGRALVIDPGHATGLRVAGNLHVLQRAWPEAEAALMRSAEAGPDRSETWVSLAYLHTVRGRFDEADAALDRALALDPLSPVVLGDAGLLLLWAGRYEDALESCATAWEVEPRAVWALSCAFDAARLAGRVDEAVTWGRRLVGLEDQPADLATLLQARVSRLERAARDGAVDPWSLSVAYAAAGARDRAAEALLRAVERPGFGAIGSAVDPRLADVRTLPAVRAALERAGIALRA